MATNAAINLPRGSQGTVVVETINDAKYVRKTYTNTASRKREYNALVALKDCPHIVKIRENNSQNSKNIYTQYGEGGDLFSYINDIIKQLLSKQLPNNSIKTIGEGKMKEIQIDKRVIPLEIQKDVMILIDKIYNILFQLLSALYCMHKRNYYHLDLKPENIVFTDKEKQNIAIIDFGFAHHNTEKLTKCWVARGTLLFSSPQKRKLMVDPIASRYICEKDDIYALGTIIKHLNKIVCDVKVYVTNPMKYRVLQSRLQTFIENTTKEEEEKTEKEKGRWEEGRWDWVKIKEWFNGLSIYKPLLNEKIYDECYRQLNLSKGGSQKAKRKTRKQPLRC